MKRDLIKEIQEQLNLQIQPFVQKLGSSLYVNLFPVQFKLIEVEGGSFLMGAQQSDPNEENYHPLADVEASYVHKVTLDTFFVGETVVTQDQWKAVMGDDERCFEFDGDNYPAVSINWNDCQRFIQRLNKMTGLKFRLPTEAEWEFAARGGNKSRGYAYSGSNEMNKVGWTDHSRDRRLHPVKMKRPNELGIYDMSGNVWEWCSDWFEGGYSYKEQINPKGPASSRFNDRVIRGGSWDDNPWHSYVFQRFACRPDETLNDCGLRLAINNLQVSSK